MVELREKIYQMLILGTEGQGYERALSIGLGGIIFFKNDIISVSQFKTLISKIKKLSKVPPFLSIDQEGGRVERTENIHNGKKYLSAKYAYEKGEKFLRNQTENIALELKDFGINLNFAPCIDTNTNPKNPIIGERAFSDNPEDVSNGCEIVTNIYRNHLIIPCVKHYPGHGDADADSHLTLPQINLSLKEMESSHIKPFKTAIDDGIEMIMAAHLYCNCFDKQKIPTSLSKNAISYLRNILKFNGVIVSDDMVMKGVADFGELEACIMGIKAGLNMFIYRNSNSDTIKIIEDLYNCAQNDTELKNNINDSYERIIRLKKKFLII